MRSSGAQNRCIIPSDPRPGSTGAGFKHVLSTRWPHRRFAALYQTNPPPPLNQAPAPAKPSKIRDVNFVAAPTASSTASENWSVLATAPNPKFVT
jgi:hypothetical protein